MLNHITTSCRTVHQQDEAAGRALGAMPTSCAGPHCHTLANEEISQQLLWRRHVATMHRDDPKKVPFVATSPITPEQKIPLASPSFDFDGHHSPRHHRIPRICLPTPATARIPTLLNVASVTANHIAGAILPVKQGIAKPIPPLLARDDIHLLIKWFQVCWCNVVPDPSRGGACESHIHGSGCQHKANGEVLQLKAAGRTLGSPQDTQRASNPDRSGVSGALPGLRRNTCPRKNCTVTTQQGLSCKRSQKHAHISQSRQSTTITLSTQQQLAYATVLMNRV